MEMADVWMTSSYLPAGASKLLPGSLVVWALLTCTFPTAGTRSGLVRILGSGLYGEIMMGPALAGGRTAGGADGGGLKAGCSTACGISHVVVAVEQAAFVAITGQGDGQGLPHSEGAGQEAFTCGWQSFAQVLQPAGGAWRSSSSLCQRVAHGLAQLHGLAGGQAGAQGFATAVLQGGAAQDSFTTGAQGFPQDWSHGLAPVAQGVHSEWPHRHLCSSRSSRQPRFWSHGVGQLWHASVPVTTDGGLLAGPVASGLPGTSTLLARQAAVNNQKERLMASCLRPGRNAGLFSSSIGGGGIPTLRSLSVTRRVPTLCKFRQGPDF